MVEGGVAPRTHLAVDHALCGTPVELAQGRAVVRLTTRREMAADDHGLVHGGFLFGAADHAAMLAVNEPTVVLAASEMAFLAPVAVGEEVEAEARVVERRGRHSRVEVTLRRAGIEVARGSFRCATLDRHVLAAR